MKKLLKPLLLALGALALFAGAFIAAALQRGATLHQLPLIGKAFPAPAEPDPDDPGVEPGEHAAPAQPLPDPVEPEQAPYSAGLGLLDVFHIEAPMSARELQELVDELERSRADAERRLRELDEREARMDERSVFLDEQLADLRDLRASLETWELELQDREAVLVRDEAAHSVEEQQGWQRMAKLFEKGEASSLARKLEAYTPVEAAAVLRHLKPERARELLEGLSGESWKLYWDAYRAAPEVGQP